MFMPKPGKTNRSMAKRFKKTGSGKLLHYRSFHSHYQLKKSKRRKRALKVKRTLPAGDARHMMRGLLMK